MGQWVYSPNETCSKIDIEKQRLFITRNNIFGVLLCFSGKKDI